MIKEFKDYTGNIKEKCDIVVIGSGAGGAVAAKEISERGYSVVLLEEGSNFTVKDWKGTPYDGMTKMYRDGGGTVTMGNAIVSVTLGKCIGGTTTINSATCFRTPDKILEKWRREFGLDHLTGENLGPYFSRVEKEINVTELSWDILGKPAEIIKRGCDRLGLTMKPLKHNVKECRGCGTCQFGCLDNAKQSMDMTYVPAAMKKGARVYADCRADSLIIEKGRARGVKGLLIDPETGKGVYTMEVSSKGVVVACGSLITPSFLKRNKVKNRNIGRHLQIHPAGRVVALMDEKVEGWKGVSQGGFVPDFEDEGIALEGIFVHPGLMTAGLPGYGKAHKELAKNYPNLACFGVMVHDSTTGRVFRSAKRNSPLATYMIQKSDLEKLKRGIAYTSKIFLAAGAKKIYTSVVKMPVIENESDIDTFLEMKISARGFEEIMAFHPLGTCRMSSSPKSGAVNREGELFNLKNCYVADAGVIPTSLGVNPQLTIMTLSTMIAGKIADRLDTGKM